MFWRVTVPIILPGIVASLLLTFQTALDSAARAHPGKRVTLWFQDEMRVGPKGRLCHRWWTRGERPPGVQDQRHEWAHMFGAVRPGSEGAFALVLPTVNTDAMQNFLDRFAATLAEDEHAVMVVDGAGWHTTGPAATGTPAPAAPAPAPRYAAGWPSKASGRRESRA